MAMAGRENDNTPPHINLLMQEFLRSQKSVLSSISLLTERVGEIRGDIRVADRIGLSVKEDLAVFRGEFNAVRGEFSAVRGELAAMREAIEGLRAEMIGRFDAVGVRLDAQDTILERTERDIQGVRSDVVALEIGILNAVQAALDAHRRLDESRDDPDASST